MRRYIRALLLCTVFAVFSGLYVYNKILLSDLPGHRIKSGFTTPKVPGDKTRPRTPHWYNRYGLFLNVISCNTIFVLKLYFKSRYVLLALQL